MVTTMLLLAFAICSVGSSMAEEEHQKISLMRTETREADVSLHLGVNGELLQKDITKPQEELDSKNCGDSVIEYTLGLKDSNVCGEGPVQSDFAGSNFQVVGHDRDGVADLWTGTLEKIMDQTRCAHAANQA